jgi:hypothetical protein
MPDWPTVRGETDKVADVRLPPEPDGRTAAPRPHATGSSLFLPEGSRVNKKADHGGFFNASIDRN